ncbi:amidase [Enterococcus sp. CU12B]|uniref:Amidase n=1 Tax=Candidatus Enterococcus willemsii TaxID=1857215 RepID=A0ABQ6YXV5_9ENTE|nr:amidase [Enterococcus sp. CU12B]
MINDGLYWAEQLKTRKISFSEYVQELEQRINDYNPTLNALVTFEKQAAIEQYEQTEGLEQTLFGGLPIPLKMLGHSKKGWLSTSGSRLFETQRSQSTSHFVQRIEQNGLIPIGQTAAPEFGFKNVTDAQIYGHTRNPWNVTCSSGGSSGGAAAAVASGMFPIATASDGGGSIRIPASFNGLIGLKPTRGTMPVGPSGWRGWQGASISFALTVSMRDTQTLFYAMRGTEAAAPYQAPQAEWGHQQASNKKLKIAFCSTSPVGSNVSQEAEQAVADAIQFLIAQGHEVVEVPYPVNGASLIRNYYQMNGAETASMFDEISTLLQREVTKEDMELMTWGIYQYGKKLPAASYVQSLQEWDLAAYQMEQLFESFDLFLSPATAHTAPNIQTDLQSDTIREKLSRMEELSTQDAAETVYEMFEKSLTLSPYTQLANLTGQPAISLPTHLTKEGMPLGIQFMASKGREDLLFQVGFAFENQQQFHLPEFYYKK